MDFLTELRALLTKHQAGLPSGIVGALNWVLTNFKPGDAAKGHDYRLPDEFQNGTGSSNDDGA